MKREDIISVITSLSMSQGFYGRLLQFLNEGSEDSEEYLNDLEEQNFTNSLELILYIEN